MNMQALKEISNHYHELEADAASMWGHVNWIASENLWVIQDGRGIYERLHKLYGGIGESLLLLVELVFINDGSLMNTSSSSDILSNQGRQVELTANRNKGQPMGAWMNQWDIPPRWNNKSHDEFMDQSERVRSHTSQLRQSFGPIPTLGEKMFPQRQAQFVWRTIGQSVHVPTGTTRRTMGYLYTVWKCVWDIWCMYWKSGFTPTYGLFGSSKAHHSWNVNKQPMVTSWQHNVGYNSRTNPMEGGPSITGITGECDETKSEPAVKIWGI